jgi:hypothetical protein
MRRESFIIFTAVNTYFKRKHSALNAVFIQFYFSRISIIACPCPDAIYVVLGVTMVPGTR